MFSAILIAAIAFAIWAYFTLFKLLVMAVWWLLKAVFRLRPVAPRSKTLSFRIGHLVGKYGPRAASVPRAVECDASQKG